LSLKTGPERRTCGVDHVLRGLCHTCYCSNSEVFFSKKDGMTVCADCAADEFYSDKGVGK